MPTRLASIRIRLPTQELRCLGRKHGRLLLREAVRRLELDPTAETRNLKTLHANPVAERELRLFGKYRILFNVDRQRREVTIVHVAEKRRGALLIRGVEFHAHRAGQTAG